MGVLLLMCAVCFVIGMVKKAEKAKEEKAKKEFMYQHPEVYAEVLKQENQQRAHRNDLAKTGAGIGLQIASRFLKK